STFAFASSSSRTPRSAAARPSLMRFWRSRKALLTGGQMNFMVNQINSAKTMTWASNVALILMRLLRYRLVAGPISRLSAADRSNERVRKHQEQRNTNADHGNGVKQAGHQEHATRKHRRHFRLAGDTFEKLTTEDTETDGGTECAKANQQADGHCGQTNNE